MSFDKELKIRESARVVLASFHTAWQFSWPFLLAHLLARLLVLAIITPVAGLFLSMAIAVRGQSVLTDQEIVYFLFSPTGLAAALAVSSLFTCAAVLDVALMTSMLQTGRNTAHAVLSYGLRFVASNFIALIGFSLALVLRILLIAAPFFIAAGIIASYGLAQYDINYYLTYWPPIFVLIAMIIAAIAVVLIVVLIRQFSSWAIALHLMLFERMSPGRAFASSAQRLPGYKARLVTTIAVWTLARGLLGLAVAAFAGVWINAIPGLFGVNLEAVAVTIIGLLLLWAFADATVTALSNGALADLLYRFYLLVSPNVPYTKGVHLDADVDSSDASIPAVALASVAVAALIGGLFAAGELLDEVTSTQPVDVIAHRGSAGTRPENTMSAINQSVEDHADWVEIDVQETADHEVVVTHDSDFMKLAGVDLKVWNATMVDLADIDIGSWFDVSYSSERTPTLRQALETLKGRGKVIIELKYYGHDVDLESRVVGIVEEIGMVSDVAVMSLKQDGIRKMRALRPNWRYGILAATAVGDLASIQADFLAVNTGQASLQLIKRAHAEGKQIYVWTVDDPLTMSRMISMGVDGLITNRPALARQVITARNHLTTYERLILWLTDRFRFGSFRLVADESDA
jgi:glycerophosphoryl diester phosphodiesterase